MRSFFCSALLIAGVLIGQQWIAKSSVAASAQPVVLSRPAMR